MNQASSNLKFIDRFRDHLPEVFYTKVPMPAFMEAPITFDLLFGNKKGKKKLSTLNKKSSSQATANILEGKLTAGKESKFAINSQDLEIDNGTWIVGHIEYGITARAKGRLQGGKFYVSQLILLKK